MMKSLPLLIVMLFAPLAQAGLYGSLDGYYFTDSFTTATSATHSRSSYALDLMANLDQNHKWYAGFRVSQFSAQDTVPGTNSQLSSMDMGPFLKWVIDRKRIFALSLGYNVIAKGTYNTGSANSELTGTSLLGTFEIAPEVSEDWHVGVKFNYYSISYTKSTSTSTAADVSYTRGLIFPSLTISYRK